MNTYDHTPINVSLTEDEAKEWKKKFAEAKIKCAKESIEHMQMDMQKVDEVLPMLQDENITFDELTNVFSILMAIAPEEQHRFLASIKTLYRLLPKDVRSKEEVMFAEKELDKLQKKDLDTKIPQFDITTYWKLYRMLLYKYQTWDRGRQVRAQLDMKKKMLQVAVNIAAKRTLGIQSAKKVLELHD